MEGEVDSDASTTAVLDSIAESRSAWPKNASCPNGARSLERSPQLDLALENAGHLLNYAIEAGIELGADIVQPIIAAERVGPAVWNEGDAGALVAAITKLAAKLSPVNSET